MSALVLDPGAFVAVDRGDRAMMARLRGAVASRVELRTSAVVLGRVWRGPDGRQARLARLLRAFPLFNRIRAISTDGRQARLARLLQAVDVRPVDERMGRRAGVLVAGAGTADPSMPPLCSPNTAIGYSRATRTTSGASSTGPEPAPR